MLLIEYCCEGSWSSYRCHMLGHATLRIGSPRLSQSTTHFGLVDRQIDAFGWHSEQLPGSRAPVGRRAHDTGRPVPLGATHNQISRLVTQGRQYNLSACRSSQQHPSQHTFHNALPMIVPLSGGTLKYPSILPQLSRKATGEVVVVGAIVVSEPKTIVTIGRRY